MGKYLLLLLACFMTSSHAEDLRFTVSPNTPSALAKPDLPDISMYSIDWARAHLPVKEDPVIRINSIYKMEGFREFRKGVRAAEWVKRQNDSPKVITIESGVATLQDIAKAVGQQYFIKLSAHTYLSRLPILINKHAAFVMDSQGEKNTLLLSLQKGVLLVNFGKLMILNSRVIGWDEETNSYAKYIDKHSFRPFLLSDGNSETYFANSEFKSLGYFAPKAYGIVINSSSAEVDTPQDKKAAVKVGPKAWLINNTFEKIYYGFYCHHANDLVIVGNKYIDNIVYGIDPHDYSNRLIIANNDVSLTREKHGIIVSREVDNSWIFNNKSYNNNLAGFMLDRQSSDNIIAFNEGSHNGSDGLSVYESPNNLIYGNVFFGNKKHGVRIRNSTEIVSSENIIQGNGQLGIYLYTADFTSQQRDLENDPYQPNVQYRSLGDQVLHNRSGALGADKLYEIYMSNMKVSSDLENSKTLFTGALSDYQLDILRNLIKYNNAITFTRVDK